MIFFLKSWFPVSFSRSIALPFYLNNFLSHGLWALARRAKRGFYFTARPSFYPLGIGPVRTAYQTFFFPGLPHLDKQTVGGHVLPGRSPRCAVAVLVQPAIQHPGDEHHALPHTRCHLYYPLAPSGSARFCILPQITPNH